MPREVNFIGGHRWLIREESRCANGAFAPRNCSCCMKKFKLNTKEREREREEEQSAPSSFVKREHTREVIRMRA